MFFFVQAVRTHVHPVTGARTVEQVPGFFLDGNIQGIIDAEAAERVATRIISRPNCTYSIEVRALRVKLEPLSDVRGGA